MAYIECNENSVIPLNYKLIRKHLVSRGGGIATGAKVDLRFIVLEHCLSEILCCKIHHVLSFLFVVAYHAPNNPVSFREELDVIVHKYVNAKTR